MGLHGGWIFGIKTIGVFGLYTREELGWMFGATDPKIVSGVFTWGGMLLVAIAVHQITRSRSGLSNGPTKPRMFSPASLRKEQI